MSGVQRTWAKRVYSRSVAEWVYVGAVVLFGLAVIVQFFLAGEAALIAPEDWQLHVAWVHLFQWLSVCLPVLAYPARHKWSFTALNCLPIVLIGLQYVLIHRAISFTAAPLAGLHAVSGTVLIVFVTLILQDCCKRSRRDGSRSGA